MANFVENLEHLKNVDAFALMKLFGEDGEVAAIIENKPGSNGSFRVYYHVALKWGGVGPKAAEEALELFAEHAEDARQHPGKHPNIDRMLDSIARDVYYSVRCYPV